MANLLVQTLFEIKAVLVLGTVFEKQCFWLTNRGEAKNESYLFGLCKSLQNSGVFLIFSVDAQIYSPNQVLSF